MSNRKYILKKGEVLRPYGVNSLLDNDNLTDDAAEMLIKKGRANKNQFINLKTKNNGNNK